MCGLWDFRLLVLWHFNVVSRIDTATSQSPSLLPPVQFRTSGDSNLLVVEWTMSSKDFYGSFMVYLSDSNPASSLASFNQTSSFCHQCQHYVQRGSQQTSKLLIRRASDTALWLTVIAVDLSLTVSTPAQYGILRLQGLPEQNDTTPALEDHDSDGIYSIIDNCRDAFNPFQVDSDSDGEGDACSYTPNNPPAFGEEVSALVEIVISPGLDGVECYRRDYILSQVFVRNEVLQEVMIFFNGGTDGFNVFAILNNGSVPVENVGPGFGRSLAIDENRLFVGQGNGSSQGSIQMFHASTNWGWVSSLTGDAAFGSILKADSNLLVSVDMGSNILLYQRSPFGLSDYFLTQTMQGPEHLHDVCLVADDATDLIVGCGGGQCYVYETCRKDGDSPPPLELRQIISPYHDDSESFGESGLACTHHTIAVSASTGRIGRTYIYGRKSNRHSFSLSQVLSPHFDDSGSKASFGHDVHFVNKLILLISAPLYDQLDPLTEQAGIVSVYRKSEETEPFLHSYDISDPAQDSNANFGVSMCSTVSHIFFGKSDRVRVLAKVYRSIVCCGDNSIQTLTAKPNLVTKRHNHF